MKTYGLIGSFEMVVDGAGSGCPPGYVEMQYDRPDGDDTLDYTAQLDGTWIISAETLRAKAAMIEDAWRSSEMAFIADNLLYIEDENELATPPLVPKDWRTYRAKVMAWQGGAESYPDVGARPVRPV